MRLCCLPVEDWRGAGPGTSSGQTASPSTASKYTDMKNASASKQTLFLDQPLNEN